MSTTMHTVYGAGDALNAAGCSTDHTAWTIAEGADGITTATCASGRVRYTARRSDPVVRGTPTLREAFYETALGETYGTGFTSHMHDEARGTHEIASISLAGRTSAAAGVAMTPDIEVTSDTTEGNIRTIKGQVTLPGTVRTTDVAFGFNFGEPESRAMDTAPRDGTHIMATHRDGTEHEVLWSDDNNNPLYVWQVAGGRPGQSYLPEAFTSWRPVDGPEYALTSEGRNVGYNSDPNRWDGPNLRNAVINGWAVRVDTPAHVLTEYAWTSKGRASGMRCEPEFYKANTTSAEWDNLIKSGMLARVDTPARHVLTGYSRGHGAARYKSHIDAGTPEVELRRLGYIE